jgi:hypothetical protein
MPDYRRGSCPSLALHQLGSGMTVRDYAAKVGLPTKKRCISDP